MWKQQWIAGKSWVLLFAPGKGVATNGLLGPNSVLRQMGQEPVCLLGGGRALLLQLAHPLVAAGVADHSGFRTKPLQRLQRTLDLMRMLIYGDRHQAEASLRQFHSAHARISGSLREAVGPYPAGAPYSAHDPALKLWVHAALIDTHLLIYERFVRPLSPADRLRFYEETRLLATWMGIPSAMIPPSLEEFRRYVDGMLAGQALAVSDTARATAWALLDPPVWFVPRACAHLVRFVTAGVLPESLRRAYGLVWNERREGALNALIRFMRLLPSFSSSPLRLMLEPGGSGPVSSALSGEQGRKRNQAVRPDRRDNGSGMPQGG